MGLNGQQVEAYLGHIDKQRVMVDQPVTLRWKSGAAKQKLIIAFP